MDSKPPSLGIIFWTFLKIGSVAFGGLMSLVAVVEQVVVERLKWLNHEDILDGISLATCLPGAISVNVVAYAGYQLRGSWGAIASIVGVTLPSFLLVVGIAMAYFQFGQIPAVENLFAGIIPAIMAIIWSTAWNMSRKAIHGFSGLAIMIIALLLLVIVGGTYMPCLIIFTAGTLGWFNSYRQEPGKFNETRIPQVKLSFKLSGKIYGSALLLLGLLISSIYLIQSSGWENIVLLNLLVTFAGVGGMLFGGAYVGIPVIQELVVHQYHWLTPTEFAYAIAVGQITPGPIIISAAFIGYKVKGLLGALTATTGIFLLPTILIIAGARMLRWLKYSARVQAALSTIRPAVIGTIIAAGWIVGKTATYNSLSIAILVGSLLALIRLHISFVWIILTASLLGLLFY